MSKFYLFTSIVVLISNLAIGQEYYLTADQVENLASGNNNKWIDWSQSDSELAKDLSSVDNRYVFIESVDGGLTSDTLFVSGFSYSGNLNDKPLQLRIDFVRKVPSPQDIIFDKYLVLTYQGREISKNIARTDYLWTTSKDTVSYFIHPDSLLEEVNVSMFHDVTFGFKYVAKTGNTTSSVFQSWIEKVSLYIKTGVATGTGYDERLDKKTSVFPNPFSDEVFLSLSEEDIRKSYFTLYNSIGQKVSNRVNWTELDFLKVEGCCILEIMNDAGVQKITLFRK